MSNPQVDTPGVRDFQQRLDKIEELIQGLAEIADPAQQARARDLVQLVLDLHGLAIERMLDMVYESGAAGQGIIEEMAKDEMVGNLLLLHGLHPFDLETRVRQALEKVRPYMKSHGGNVELLGVDESGVVRLRLEGSCHECGSSRVTLKYAVENAIYAVAPDVTGIEAKGLAPAPAPLAAGFIPVNDIFVSTSYAPTDGGTWVNVELPPDLADNSLQMGEFSGVPVLFARIAGALYAYGATCPRCASPLEQAVLEGGDLTCPDCGHRYDLVRAGRDRDGTPVHLTPFPLLEEGGQVRVALPAHQDAGTGKHSASAGAATEWALPVARQEAAR